MAEKLVFLRDNLLFQHHFWLYTVGTMDIIVIAHNIRSTYNVGSIFRTCDGFGVKHLYLTGYTPYPVHSDDTRLPHEATKLTKQIHKSALGAESTVAFTQASDLSQVLNRLRTDGYRLVALEQHAQSILLPAYKAPHRIALLLGEEVNGINGELLEQCDDIVEIPMQGAKESFNVSVAAGVCLYALTTPPLR